MNVCNMYIKTTVGKTRHRVQTGYGAHPTSYPMDTGGSFLGSKTTGA